MREEDLRKKLQKDGETIEIPESLKPDRIQNRLEQSARKKKRTWVKVIAGAAALMLVVGSGLLLGQTKGKDSDSYGELYQTLQELTSQQNSLIDNRIMDKASGGVREKAARTFSEDESAKESFSDTNIQVEGVDEGDIVKTDGEYLYVLDRDYVSVSIVKAKAGKMKTCSVIPLDSQLTAQELYVEGDRLSVTGTRQAEKGGVETIVRTYDMKDRQKPEHMGTVAQSGELHTSRMEGGYLYIFSNYYPDLPESRNKTDQYVPLVNGETIKMPEIIVPENPQTPQYLVMTAIDLTKPDRASDRKSVLSSGDTFYVSQKHIYAASDRSQDGKDTEIRKFSYKDGKIQYQTTGKVKGYFNDSFSMDEYKGYLRLVTTLNGASGSTYNNVYVLDENMKVTGSILKLAKDERIYSARFLQDRGYFVTYRQTDPLFSVDLSDPANPKILGALKIPGFSEYLHFYGKDRLLGIGQAADENAVTSGVKLSMFDISDPSQVKEESTVIIKDTFDAEVLSNHRAVMIDPEKNIFGFAASGRKGAGYYIYRYENGFKQVFKEPVGNNCYDIRGLYIGDVFYLVQMNQIRSYQLSDFKKIDLLNI